MIEADTVIWGCVAVLIISLMSIIGGLFLPFLQGNARRQWYHFFIAMAVATLSTDALLHLIPEALGVHHHSPKLANATEEHDHDEHDHHGHGHGHSHTESLGIFTISEDRELLLKMSIPVLAVILFYVCELVHSVSQQPGCHKHGNLEESPSPCTLLLPRASAGNNAVEPAFECEESSKSSELNSGKDLVRSRRDSGSADPSAPAIIWGIRSTAMIILVGDGVHNLLDGVAMGASFSSSIKLGVSTSIAVLCHELPHELGDMVILLQSGLPMWKALFLNFLSALTAFIGFFIGLVSQIFESLSPWLLALTAGMFLYVGWCDMLTHLKNGMGMERNTLLTCVLQALGFTCGFLIIFLIGWFEHSF